MDEKEGRLRLALKIVSGRLHPSNLSSDQVYLLGFEHLDDVDTDRDVLEAAEGIVFDAITGKIPNWLDVGKPSS